MVHQVHHVHILFGVERFWHLVYVLPAHVSVVTYLYLAFLTLLGGDEDHTICSRRTIDSSRSSILEHVDTLDVGRVEGVDVAASHTVDDVDRIGAAVGTCTTDIDLESIARLTGIGLDGHTRSLALESAEHLCGVEFGNVLTLHLQSGTSDEFFLLHAITHDHNFIEHVGVFGEGDAESALVAHRNFLCGVTNVGNHKHSTRLHIESELTVEVGNRSVAGAFLHDGSPDDRSHRVGDDTTDFP